MKNGNSAVLRVKILLKRCESRVDTTAQAVEIKPQVRCPRSLQTTQRFPEKYGGSTIVASLQMELSNSHLQDPLKASTLRVNSFMPDLLEHVVSGVPLLHVEKLNGLFKAGIRL